MKPALAALTIASLFLATGCESISGHRPGGRMASLDQYTYESYPYLPQTVTLLDLRDGQEIWSMDVPVGYKLVTRFYNDKSDNPAMPDIMRWAVVPSSRKVADLGNQMPVPDSGVRRLEVAYRQGPEETPDVANPRPKPFVDVPESMYGKGG